MHRIPILAAPLLGALLLSAACASSPTALEASDRAAIRSLRIVSVVPQAALQAQIYTSMTQFDPLIAARGTIVDEVVEVTRAAVAREQLEPFRALLGAYDAEEELHRALERALPGVAWTQRLVLTDARPLALDEESGAPLARPFDVERHLAEAAIPEDAVLVLETGYALTPELELLEAVTRVRLFETSAAKAAAGAAAPLFETRLVSQSRPIDREGAEERWLAQGGERLRTALAAAWEEQARLVVHALEDPRPLAASEEPSVFPVEYLEVDGRSPGSRRGWVVSEEPDRTRVRLRDGSLYSVARAEPLRPAWNHRIVRE